MASAGADLEVLPLDEPGPDPDDGHEPEQRPHPLGMRDVIDVVAAAGRYALIGGAVALAAVGGFLVGEANRPLEINRSPISATGVLWACDGNLSGRIRLTGLPPGIVQLRVAGEVVAGVDDPNYGPPDTPHRYVVGATGSLDTLAAVADPGGGPQLALEVESPAGAPVLTTTILRVPCT